MQGRGWGGRGREEEKRHGNVRRHQCLRLFCGDDFVSVEKVCRTWHGPDLATLTGHTSWVLSVVLNNDGSRICLGSRQHGACLECGHRSRSHADGACRTVGSVAFNHDVSRIVSGSHDMTVRVRIRPPEHARAR